MTSRAAAMSSSQARPSARHAGAWPWKGLIDRPHV
jgi:hypothetical protein